MVYDLDEVCSLYCTARGLSIIRFDFPNLTLFRASQGDKFASTADIEGAGKGADWQPLAIAPHQTEDFFNAGTASRRRLKHASDSQ
jgi:hypothetical protein